MLHLIMVPFQITLHSLVAGYLIWSLTLNRGGILFRMMNHPVAITVGVLSYSLYLWQQPFLSYAQTYAPAQWQRFPQNMGLVLLVATLSYFLVEKPILGLKRYFKPAPIARRNHQTDNTAVSGNSTENVLP
jgi:peptidoglycan/LPS O-acetylase OafA/YrhL